MTSNNPDQEKTIEISEMSVRGDDKKSAPMSEALIVVNRALKDKKIVIKEDAEGNKEIVRAPEDIDEKTEKLTTAQPVSGG